VQGKKNLFEEMKDQKSWVGVFFYDEERETALLFVPQENIQACCIDCYLECKTEHGI
jgi:hypothetical protein